MRYFLFTLAIVLLTGCSSSSLKVSRDLFFVEGEMSVNLSSLDGFEDTFFISHKEFLSRNGWSYSDGVLTLSFLLPEKTFFTEDGFEIHSNSQSQIDTSGINRQSLTRLTVDSYSTPVTLIFNNGKYILDSNHFFFNMDCCPPTKVVDNTPRCKDYNGPYGDQQNDAGGLQEIINFIGSDCNLAMMQGLCLDEHSNGTGGCFATHGGKLCTELINR